MISPIPEAKTLLLFLLWLFTNSLPALDAAASFPGLEVVCREDRAAEITGEAAPHPASPPTRYNPQHEIAAEKLDHLFAGMLTEEETLPCSEHGHPPSTATKPGHC